MASRRRSGRGARDAKSGATRALPRSVLFRQLRQSDWRALDAILARAARVGLRRLSGADLERLPVLYRGALSSLIVARETATDRELVRYLEALTARGYLIIYGSRRAACAPVLDLLLERFPREVRAAALEVSVAFGLLVAGVVLAAALVHADPSWFDAFVEEALQAGRNPGASTTDLQRGLYEHGADGLSAFSAMLFTHNAGIGLFAYGLGIAAGIPSAFLMFKNGLMLGAFGALYAERGLLIPLLGWLLPHGVPELTAVVLCGAAGLRLGRGLLFPGALQIRDALQLQGKGAAVIAAGSLLLFAVAGVLEGVFRQLVVSDALRFAVVLADVVWLAVWLWLGGRATKERR